MKTTFTRLASICVLGLIFLSQFVPTTYIEIKAVLLGLALCFVLIAMASRSLFLLRWQVVGIVILVGCALCYSLYGLVRGNPGAVRVLSVWFMWPVLYLLLSSLMIQPNAYRWLMRVSVAALIAVVAYGYLYLGNIVGVVPGYAYLELDQGQAIGFHEGFVEYNLYSISSIVFLLPLYLHYLLEKQKRTGRTSWLSLLLVLAAVVLSVLSGRRAMLLVLLLLPLTIYFSNVVLGNRYKLKVGVPGAVKLGIVALGVAALIISFGLRYRAIVDMFLDGFDFASSSSSASERTLQFVALVDGWIKSSILFGAGNGAAAAISRSEEFPWAYELTYVYLLFSTGLIGVSIYCGWYAYGLMRLRRAIIGRPDLMIYAAPMLTASVSFCIAAATNPYFGKFDYLWIVLLPFLIGGWASYQRQLAK